MRVRAALSLATVATSLLLLLWQGLPWGSFFLWTAEMQRLFQDEMARGLRAVEAGQAAAVASLCAATAFYGFVHAAGPGHGKVLLGGAALASGASLRRMAALTVLSSLAQAATAIAMVGVLAVGLRMGALQMGEAADAWLAPASYAAIAVMGAYLVGRGVRMMRHPKPGRTACGCGRPHGPSSEEVASLTGWRDGSALVASIALRPCTGALFLLAIALRLDLFWCGALAVVAMGVGTATFNMIVAGSGVLARRVAILGAGGGELRVLAAGSHVLGGVFIVVISLGWLGSALTW